jgi:hypothetical protein
MAAQYCSLILLAIGYAPQFALPDSSAWSCLAPSVAARSAIKAFLAAEKGVLFDQEH